MPDLFGTFVFYDKQNEKGKKTNKNNVLFFDYIFIRAIFFIFYSFLYTYFKI